MFSYIHKFIISWGCNFFEGMNANTSGQEDEGESFLLSPQSYPNPYRGCSCPNLLISKNSLYQRGYNSWGEPATISQWEGRLEPILDPLKLPPTTGGGVIFCIFFYIKKFTMFKGVELLGGQPPPFWSGRVDGSPSSTTINHLPLLLEVGLFHYI